MKKLEKTVHIETVIEFEDERDNIVVDTWNVYTTNDVFAKVFGKKAKEFSTYLKKKKVIKITSENTKKPIYRFWNGAPLGAKAKDTLFLDKNAKYDLLSNTSKNSDIDVVISKGTKFSFFWNHYDHATRISFKLALLSLILGIISFIFGIFSIILTLR